MEKPNFSYERKWWKKGLRFVVGIDEAGRGAWAGPIVVSAVVWPRPLKLKIIENLGINDSKLIKPRQRERLAREIKKRVLAWDVTEVGVGVINRVGIGKATQKAMRKSIKDIMGKLGWEVGSESGSRDEKWGRKKTDKLSLKGHFVNEENEIPEHLPLFILVDYFYIPYLRGLGLKNQLAIKNGDQKSISIAAASILAKVHRDQIMRRLTKEYPLYGWGRNKGYGTKAHQKAILRYGLTQYHRREFVKNLLAK